MNYAQLLNENFEKGASENALITSEGLYTYGDISNEFKSWRKKLTKLQFKPSSTVMVRGEFNKSSIGLMLALIELNCIYIPVSTAVIDYKKFQQIAEVEYFFNLIDDQFEKLWHTVSNHLTKKLIEEKKPGLILFSSGTTGEPKAALHNFCNMLDKYVDHPGRSIVSIAFLLFDHIGGVNTVIYNLFNLGTIVVPENRTPEKVLETIEANKVEVLPTSPSFLNMVLVSRAYENRDISSLNVITYGTESMPESTLKAFNNFFPNIRLKQTYGLSEVGILRSKSKGSDSLWVKLGGDKTHQLEVRDGILWIKSTSSMMGYLNATSPFDNEGWFNTQDRVEVDGEYFKILGRDTDLINVGGEKVYPVEVESEILKVPNVVDVIVKGEKNPIVGNVVVAHVSIGEDADFKAVKKEIKQNCQEKLEKFKRPVKIIYSENDFCSARFKRKRS